MPAAKKSSKKKNAKTNIKSNAQHDDENILGMLAHLLGLFTGFMGPLILFLVTNDKKGSRSNENAKHALNFQISIIIYYIIAFALIFTIIGIVITIFLFIAIPIFSLIVEIIGSVKAYQGEVYKYPLEIPFIS